MKVGQPGEMPKVSTPSSTGSGAAAPVKADQDPVQTAKGAAVSSGVAVTVSTSVRTLEQAKHADAAEIDNEKVKAVRQAIEDGTYVVNPEAIADKLLANAQEMLHRTQN